MHCNTIFTTYESPSLRDVKVATHTNTNNSDHFSLSRLTVSISKAFSHDAQRAQYDSLSLAQTVETKLLTSKEQLSSDTIANVTYRTLKHFDELAAIQYAASHHLITTIRRQGRPSLSSLRP